MAVAVILLAVVLMYFTAYTVAIDPTSNLGCYGSRGFVRLLRHSVTIARTQVFTGFMTSEGMCRVA